MAAKFKFLSAGGDSKGLNIFKSSSYKEHLQKPMAALFWKIRWASGIWLSCALAFGIAFAIEHLWRYGWSPATAKWMSMYFQNMLFSGGLSVLAEIPYWLGRVFLRTDIATITPLIPILIYYILSDATLVSEFNPHGNDKFNEKSSNKATAEDIKKMKKPSLIGGFMMVLGWFKIKGKSTPLMMDECLSALCLAPPGTGKTQGIVLNTIFKCNTVSMIINDPKPEIDKYSSGYRAAKVGPVFIMNWAGQDDPEHGIYYPSWNPLSPEHVPFNGEQRDLYIDSMCNVLIAEKQSSSADPHWTISGRAALSGLVHFIVSKIERAKADDYFYSRIAAGAFDAEDAQVLGDYYTAMVNDPNSYAAYSMLMRGELNAMNYVHIGTWDGIPDNWRGKEASLSMILDWLNTEQIRIAAELENRRKQGDQMVMMADAQKDLFMSAVNEARQYAYSHRSILELTQIANTPDKERGSILSTVMAGLGIFRNAAVRNRTSHSDFHFNDLRGLLDPRDGKIKPVSVYLSINMVNAEALNPITGIFIELMSSFLLANAPNSTNDKGETMGPTPVLFVLDEMPKMQKLQAVIQGPDLGRSQQISYLIIGQDIHQIAEKYGNDAAATIISTTAAKVVLRQNDPDTAKRFSDMMGFKMKIGTKKDEKTGEEKDDPKPDELLYSQMDIMKLDKKKQIVIVQGYYNRPIEADNKQAYEDEEMKGYMAMGRSSPLPEFLIPSHHAAMGYGGPPKVYNPLTKELKVLEPAK